jgi:hypothetical protein
VVVDHAASLTDTSVIAWHGRLAGQRLSSWPLMVRRMEREAVVTDYGPPGRVAAERIPAQLRAASPSWRALALAVVLVGVPAGIAACAALLQIDADTLVPTSAADAFVAVMALVIGFGGICCGSILLGLRWWARPAAAITPAGVVVYNWRPLLVPWPMISAVTSLPRSGRGPGPGLALVNGEVVALRFVPQTPFWSAPDGARFGRFDVTEMIGQARPGNKPADRAAATERHKLGPLLRRHELPEILYTALAARRLPWSWWAAPFVIAFLSFGRLATVAHHQSIDAAQILSAMGAILIALFLAVAVIWARWARAVAIGADWIAWRPRLATRWRVVSADELVSIAPGVDVSRRGVAPRTPWTGRRRSGGQIASYGPFAPADLDIALCRSDGRGIRLGPNELDGGTAAALLQAFGSHPGLTDEARQRLTGHLPGYEAG